MYYKPSYNVILNHAGAGEESLIISGPIRTEIKSEMFESLASWLAFRCSTALNMTAPFTKYVLNSLADETREFPSDI
jgi:hypothetical protein